MRKTIPLIMVCGAVVAACRPAAPPPADALATVFGHDAVTWIDLSYAYGDETIFWPTAKPFALEVVAAGVTAAGFYYAANNFAMAEHGGTHLDAPVHFAEGRHAADEIPLERLVGPAVVIDVSEQAAANADYQVTTEDLIEWEAVHGRLRDGVILLVRTGWGARWPDRERYLGTARTGPAAVPELHFPGIHPDAARWLVDRRALDAVGIDTPSIDYGQSTTFETHQVLYGANIPGFENVAHLDRLPLTGAYVIALPMKIAGGSGGPLRIVAVLPS